MNRLVPPPGLGLPGRILKTLNCPAKHFHLAGDQSNLGFTLYSAFMNTTVTAAKTLGTLRAHSGASETWSELVGAMPVVIFYRAVREVFRRRAHRRAVLEAFRR